MALFRIKLDSETEFAEQFVEAFDLRHALRLWQEERRKRDPGDREDPDRVDCLTRDDVLRARKEE